jgi:hypothetical protein
MRRLAKLHAASVVLHDQHPESMSIYDQSFFAEPIVREGLSKFFSGTYYRSQMSLLTVVTQINFQADRYEFTNFRNVTPCDFDRKLANYGPLRHDIL